MTNLPSVCPVKSQSGQILLIILLMVAVCLTIGLSIISSSISDISMSGRSDDSARAFSAAEAGIEQGLVTGVGTTGNTFSSGASYQAVTANLGENQTVFAFPGDYTIDDPVTFWFATYNRTNGQYTKSYDRNGLKVVWGYQNSTEMPAIEVAIYYLDSGVYKIGRFALDPVSRGTTGSDCADGMSNCFCQKSTGSFCSSVGSFTDTGETLDGQNFKYSAQLDLSSFTGVGKTLLMARGKLYYSSSAQIIGMGAIGSIISGTGTFPTQGTVIQAVGQSGSSTKKVQVRRLFSTPPAFLDSLLYSGGDITHQ